MQNLHWKKVDNTHFLCGENETLLTLQINTNGNSSFKINSKEYTISKKGFWNPVIHIDAENTHILTLTHSLWGNSGRVVFYDGKTYTSYFKTGSHFKYSFLNNDREILSYNNIFVDKKSYLQFQIIEALLDADKLLILAALGMKVFSTYSKEISGDDGTFFLLTIA
ncbi:MAG: hypothetical protein ACOVO1_11820 [Chitinophagaceae bacterium]